MTPLTPSTTCLGTTASTAFSSRSSDSSASIGSSFRFCGSIGMRVVAGGRERRPDWPQARQLVLRGDRSLQLVDPHGPASTVEPDCNECLSQLAGL
jgi:hypothetical protein